MRARAWAAGLAACLLTGCGVPIGGFLKPSSSVISDGSGAAVSAIGQNAFAPRLDLAPQLSTGEQDRLPTGLDDSRGVAGVSQRGAPFKLEFEAGAAAQIVVAGPPRSDLVLRFNLLGVPQRVDGDPLSPDLSVESFVLSADRALAITLVVTDFTGERINGPVRWYAFLLPSSLGRVSAPGEETGPAGTVALPGTASFTADQRGRKLEVIVIGATGTDLTLDARIGESSLAVNHDPQSPDRTIEGFVLEVDDPADVSLEISSLGGVAGDARWAVLPLPPEDRRARPGR